MTNNTIIETQKQLETAKTNLGKEQETLKQNKDLLAQLTQQLKVAAEQHAALVQQLTQNQSLLEKLTKEAAILAEAIKQKDLEVKDQEAKVKDLTDRLKALEGTSKYGNYTFNVILAKLTVKLKLFFENFHFSAFGVY